MICVISEDDIAGVIIALRGVESGPKPVWTEGFSDMTPPPSPPSLTLSVSVMDPKGDGDWADSTA
jgi:hypothetical protein